MLSAQPERSAIFAWLRVVATREAYRLSVIDRRDGRFECLRLKAGDEYDVAADPRSLEHAVEALEVLRLMTRLPDPTDAMKHCFQRVYLRLHTL